MNARHEQSATHLMIVLALAVAGLLMLFATKGCEYDGGRPADAHCMR